MPSRLTFATDAALRAKEMRCVRVEVQIGRTRESYERGFYGKHGFSEADSRILRMDLDPE